ncbi:hypothetical protein NDU88_001125 [Pleurodeles waltl]|uniref:Uncharacterized protein n=1 Tax=Pleurodeles waltl TaxID=8319 RepID=A0AAV7NDV9_PLEWA|nr:hypothetical protein NDU88_001125 [Pleurodeles waltl]
MARRAWRCPDEMRKSSGGPCNTAAQVASRSHGGVSRERDSHLADTSKRRRKAREGWNMLGERSAHTILHLQFTEKAQREMPLGHWLVRRAVVAQPRGLRDTEYSVTLAQEPWDKVGPSWASYGPDKSMTSSSCSVSPGGQ